MATEVAEEQRLGPILSVLDAKRFDSLELFHTPPRTSVTFPLRQYERKNT